jgi:hypothetical protein
MPTLVLGQEEPDRPVEAGIRIGGDELGPKRRITEDKQNGWTKLCPSLCGEVRLINFAEKLNAFFGDRPLNAFGGLLDRYLASHPDDAVVLGGGRSHRPTHAGDADDREQEKYSRRVEHEAPPARA